MTIRTILLGATVSQDGSGAPRNVSRLGSFDDASHAARVSECGGPRGRSLAGRLGEHRSTTLFAPSPMSWSHATRD